jgi:hypothetical protein
LIPIQPPQQVQSEPFKPLLGAATVLPILKEFGPWFYALVVGALYVSGFLVLNSNLAKSGVLDVEFVDARYFLASAGFAFYLVCFYFFAGRAVLFTPKWLREDLARLNNDGAKPVWSFVVFVHSNINSGFFCCLSAALFTSVAIDSAESALFYAALSGCFLISYTFDVTNLDLRFPKCWEAVGIITKSIAIYTFFIHGGAGVMLFVFFSYAAIFAFINFVLDSFARYKHTADRLTFTGIYAIFMLLSTAIAYGTLFYGQVTTKLGGARPQTVWLGLSDEARKALPVPFAAASGQILNGKLIHQTPAYTYIASSGHTLRIRTADVVAMVSTAEPASNFWKGQFEPAASAPTPPNPSPKGTAGEKSAAAPAAAAPVARRD